MFLRVALRNRDGTVVALIVLITAAVFYKLTIDRRRHFRARSVRSRDLHFGKSSSRTSPNANRFAFDWWYGWGIHLTPYGWLYNVSGWDAVAITLRNGRRVSLGTDQPNELCAAIRRSASAK